jgi:hypothetical protein
MGRFGEHSSAGYRVGDLGVLLGREDRRCDAVAASCRIPGMRCR